MTRGLRGSKTPFVYQTSCRSMQDRVGFLKPGKVQPQADRPIDGREIGLPILSRLHIVYLERLAKRYSHKIRGLPGAARCANATAHIQTAKRA